MPLRKAKSLEPVNIPKEPDLSKVAAEKELGKKKKKKAPAILNINTRKLLEQIDEGY